MQCVGTVFACMERQFGKIPYAIKKNKSWPKKKPKIEIKGCPTSLSRNIRLVFIQQKTVTCKRDVQKPQQRRNRYWNNNKHHTVRYLYSCPVSFAWTKWQLCGRQVHKSYQGKSGKSWLRDGIGQQQRLEMKFMRINTRAN